VDEEKYTDTSQDYQQEGEGAVALLHVYGHEDEDGEGNSGHRDGEPDLDFAQRVNQWQSVCSGTVAFANTTSPTKTT
jgi:hypothetical protein